MRNFRLLVMGLALLVAAGIEATESPSGSLPSLTYPSSEELGGLTPEPPIKGEYETTTEFEARVARLKESQQSQITAFIRLNVQYQADEERYEISSCGNYRVSGFEDRQNFSGQNAMGAAWDWVEVTGRRNVVAVEDCKNIYIRMNLENARAIRETVTAIGAVTLSTQKPYTSGNTYQSPEFGKYLVDKTRTYKYQGLLDGIYLGRRDTKEVLRFLDFSEKNKRLQDTREALAAEESDWLKSSYFPIIEVIPIYPRRAQSRGITGFCDVTFTVTVTGTVRDPSADYCSPPGIFNRASVAAAKKLKYKPHTENGKPIEVTDVRYKFVYEL